MALKCVTLLLVCCLAAAVVGSPDDDGKFGKILTRTARSPEKGSVQVDYTQDQFGKRGSVQYNHNLHTSSDGRLKVDAYARGSRDFTHNRNDYGGGIQGSYRF